MSGSSGSSIGSSRNKSVCCTCVRMIHRCTCLHAPTRTPTHTRSPTRTMLATRTHVSHATLRSLSEECGRCRSAMDHATPRDVQRGLAGLERVVREHGLRVREGGREEEGEERGEGEREGEGGKGERERGRGGGWGVRKRERRGVLVVGGEGRDWREQTTTTPNTSNHHSQHPFHKADNTSTTPKTLTQRQHHSQQHFVQHFVQHSQHPLPTPPPPPPTRQGVHGTLIDLIDVNPKLHAAVDVTAGNQLFNVVVDNDEVATTIVRHLNRDKLGR